MDRKIKFELKPKERQKLTQDIASALNTIPRYLKTPTFAYEIGECRLEIDVS